MTTKPFKLCLWVLWTACALAVTSACDRSAETPVFKAASFANEVDLGPLNQTAVQADGRLRSFESHAKVFMGFVTGGRQFAGQSHAFTYLDLMFRPGEYHTSDYIYVKKKVVRKEFVQALEGHPSFATDRAADFMKSGLIAPVLLQHPSVVRLLQRLGADLIRTSREVDAINFALTVSEPGFLMRELRVVAQAEGETGKPWFSMREIVDMGGVPRDAAHAGVAAARPLPGLDSTLRGAIRESWSRLGSAWISEDAPAVNVAVAKLAERLREASPGGVYPDAGRLAMESWYFRNKSMTWLWVFYLIAIVPLLMSVIYKWNGARVAGLGLFVLAFAAHTVSIGIRWYISGRWPNSNMFEAVTTSVWFGAVVALILEGIARKTPFRNLFALGAATASMFALMAAYFLPASLDSGIKNKMAALNDVWLYIHTNMIIASYALIALAAVTAMLLLVHRWGVTWRKHTIPGVRLLIIPIALVALNWTAYKLFMRAVDPIGHGLSPQVFAGMAMGMVGSAVYLVLELMDARVRRRAGERMERSAIGGAAEIVRVGRADDAFVKQAKPTLSQVFDGATMVLMELAFITLWTGLVMGAIWADHSWGRPWGWDPKEVFALNTFFIFLILVHVRIKVKDKGFWTAILAVFGFEVMMFNWIAVNFLITGLHSYA